MHFAIGTNELSQEMSTLDYELCGGNHIGNMYKILADEYFPRPNSFQESNITIYIMLRVLVSYIIPT